MTAQAKPKSQNRDERPDRAYLFKPGQSGNPGGRPKGLAKTIRESVPAHELVRHFQAIFSMDLTELERLRIDPAAVTVADRSKAGDWLADRGYGKAPNYAPVEGSDPLELGDLDRAVAATVDELAGHAKLMLLAGLQSRLWEQRARPEQLPPDGDWRVWYLRGGRGAGKTRTGAETLRAMDQRRTSRASGRSSHPPSGTPAPSAPKAALRAHASARWQGAERRRAGTAPKASSDRANGSKVYLDGADDGALRVQGKNLRGLWADEVGLWRDWDRAWNESIRVRRPRRARPGSSRPAPRRWRTR